MIGEVHNVALTGLQNNMQSMRKSAQEIAGNDDQTKLAQSMVELNQASHAAEANTKVVKAADEVIGSLIDLRA